MPVIIIAAVSQNDIIGEGEALPWDVPEEYAHYLGLVGDHPTIMGRRSYGIFGNDLAEGQVIVLSRSVTELPGATVAGSLDEAISIGRERSAQVFVAGGGQVYAQALERADALYLSRIKQRTEGDTRFPAIDDAVWSLFEEVDHPHFVFAHYRRAGAVGEPIAHRSVRQDHRAWARLGSVVPAHLWEARVSLHWAVQLIGSAGRNLVRPRPDDSHTNLLWSRERHGFVGRELPTGHRVLLDPLDWRVGLVDGGEAEAETLSLTEQTLESAYAWLAARLADVGNEPPPNGLEVPDYDLPAHPVTRGEAFGRPRPDHLHEISLWYANAASILLEIAATHGGASEIRCWPHHFDIATLMSPDPDPDADADADAESARSVGVGLSPGDEGYPEPYFYVTPWPYPKDPPVPDLPAGGHWHREGWFGAVLQGSRLIRAGSAARQEAAARDFLVMATHTSLDLL